jgi:hypothetical protein
MDCEKFAFIITNKCFLRSRDYEKGEIAMSMEQETIQKIVKNYQCLEQSLVQQLQLEVHGHHPTTGTYREEVWKSLFEQIIPI